jgi:hypothetical protein
MKMDMAAVATLHWQFLRHVTTQHQTHGNADYQRQAGRNDRL